MTDFSSENFVLQASNHAFSAVWKQTRVNKKNGWLTLASSNGTTKDTSGVQANDLWGGNADPNADTYPVALDTVNAWIVQQGPTTLMLSMTAAPTGSFVPSEKVTQATSGAEGEFLGYAFDGVSKGHAVILPRTGTFDGTHAITGAVSGASFTPSALKTFVREVVIFKATDLVNGSIYVQCICNETENQMRFSVLATQSSCTATVAPGAAADASNNPFPPAGSTTIAAGSNGAVLPQATINVASTQNAALVTTYPSSGCILVTTSSGPQAVFYTGLTGTTFTGCSGGVGTMSTGGAVVGVAFGSFVAKGTQINGTIAHATWFGTTTLMSHGQLLGTNTTGATGVSPEGSWECCLGNTTSATQCDMFGFFRCDDGEGADVDPFVFFCPCGTSANTANVRQTAIATSELGFGNFTGSNNNMNVAVSWRGWIRRGMGSGSPVNATTLEGFASYAALFDSNPSTNSFQWAINPTNVETIACEYTVKIVRERCRLVSTDGTRKQRKGSPRRLSVMQGNTTFDTVDGKLKMVVIANQGTSGPSVLVSPLDGTTTPQQ